MNAIDTAAFHIWEIAAARLKAKNGYLYRQWFQKMLPLAVKEGELQLGVPDDFFAGWVDDNYDDLILAALTGIDDASYTYKLVPGHIAPAAADPAEEPATEKKPSAAAMQEEMPSSQQPQRQAEKPLARRPTPQNCLACHTFENFVVGAENRHAYAAARTAADTPGLYNPLYLYGGSGVGKTHLLQAVAESVKRRNPEMVVRYATCDELLNDFYNLLQQKQSLSSFRSSVRDVDVLLVDDVHSLAKKTQMQEEFFNMFNTLYNQRKQIILTSDRQPCEISDLDKRLVTRFESGMTAEVGVPEFESRLAILRMMRSDTLTKVPLDDELLEFLASNISSSIRRLKGAFIRLATYAAMTEGQRLTIEQAEELLHSQLAQECAARDISLESIQRTVASHFGITLTDILGEKRTRTVAEPRMIAMYLCRELTSNSSTEIGAAFGRNHATVLHAERKVPQLCAESESIRRSINQLKHQLQRN